MVDIRFLQRILFSGYSFSHCPFVDTCFTWCGISVLAGRISMQLTTNIHHVSQIAEKVLKVRGQTSASCVHECLKYGRGIHFDSMSSRLSCNLHCSQSRDVNPVGHPRSRSWKHLQFRLTKTSRFPQHLMKARK